MRTVTSTSTSTLMPTYGPSTNQLMGHPTEP